MIYSYCKLCKAKEEACLLPDSHRAQNKVVWCCDFLVGGKSGERIRKQFKPGITRKEVEKFEHITIADYERGTFLPKDKSKVLCEEVLDRYYNEHILENTRGGRNPLNYIRMLKKLFGHIPIGALELSKLEAERREYKARTECKNRSVNRFFDTFRAALNKACEWGYIQKNPAQYFKSLPTVETVPRFLSIEEIARLRSHIKDGRLDDYATVLLHTGIRPINLKALVWSQIDRAQRIIHLTTYKGRRPHNYSVPYDNEVARVFERRHTETQGRGTVLDTTNIRKLADETIEASGINVGRKEEERFTIYGLKHCYASHLLMSGASLFDVAKLLGHTDMTMVMRHYGHLTQEHLRSVQARINLTPQLATELKVI